MIRSKSKSGFTLVELLVVIAVIAILVAILLPAINAAREAAWRNACINNTNQLCKALLIYEEANKSFPPGLPTCSTTASDNQGSAVCQGPTWMAAIMNQIEEVKKHKTLMECLDTKWNAAKDCSVGVGDSTPKILRCPSAVVGDAMVGYGYTLPLAKGSYAGCWGAGNYNNTTDSDTPIATTSADDGVFGEVKLSKTTSTAMDANFIGKWKAGSNRGTTMAGLQDGTTKTILISEVLTSITSGDNRGAWLFGGMGGTSFTAKYPPNSSQNDVIPLCDASIPPSSVLNCTAIATAGQEANSFATARSEHSGGVVAGFGDAHTQFIVDNIDPLVWKALATKQGPSIEPEIPAEF